MSNFRIKTCVLGPISTNCYLVYNDRTKAGVIVDPADNGAYILNKCSELGLKPEAVLLTHGHCDHTSAVADVRRAFRVPVYAGEEEQELLSDPRKNLSFHMWPEQVSFRMTGIVWIFWAFSGRCWRRRDIPPEVSVITCPRRTSCLRGIRFLRIPLGARTCLRGA